MASKRKADTYDKSDPFVASDDETTSKVRPSKKSKNMTSARSQYKDLDVKKDDEGNEYWELSSARRVTISDFKGKKLVSIREFYEKDGRQLPGKKGISMTVDQYTTLINILPQIEQILTSSGESIPRPKYGGGPVTQTSDDDNRDEKDSPARRANFEATSDEDED